MLYGPDCSSSDEEGLSDDNDYHEFKKRIRKKQNDAINVELDSEVAQNRKKKQIIMSAIAYGKVEVIIDELDKGLEIDTELKEGWTPLLLSASVANEKITSELIKRGANVNQSQGDLTPLMMVCNNSSNDESVRDGVRGCVQLLLDNGADVNAIDNKRKTAFMLAAYNGHLEAVKLLLPHVDKNTEDNQRWTALFWAVDGHRTEIVKLLLKEGFDCDKVDIRGNTTMDLAHINGFEDILDLLPKDTFIDDFYLHLTNNHIHFENTFKSLNKSEKPGLFVDLCKILYGARSESVVSILEEKQVSLFDFLSLNDAKLKQLGVQLPYQRCRIMGGLFKFHKHPFQPKSIPNTKKGALYTNIDAASTVLSCIKQLIVMEASLKFIIENFEDQLGASERREIGGYIVKNRHQINRLKVVSQELVRQTEMWDSTIRPVDKITKKRWNIPWCNLYFSVGVISIAMLIALKFR